MIREIVKFLKQVLLAVFGLYCGYWLMQVTTCCSFHAPSESMTPTIVPGDFGIVNKWKLGARIFDIPGAIAGEKVEVYRLPGYGAVERNDVVVFNYPFVGRDSMGMNMRKYYCKRVVAVPGDTLEIRNCRYRVRGVDEELGNVAGQIELAGRLSVDGNPERWICLYTWPFDSVMNWTVKELGPLFIPGKGSQVRLTRENTVLYGRYIAWEQQCSQPVWRNGRAWIDGRPTDSYTFEENYYFVAGDRVENSAESRYWGLLPESMIVGVAGFLWDSVDHSTGERRWNRIFKPL
ncbi:MAG: S26 family signal peptidase [Muribaculaceae bacterium]|nr:S26 family signal peptidase [Muribaculaceae bacterium]